LDGNKWEERFELREERKVNEWLFVIDYELHMKVKTTFLSLSKWCVMVVVMNNVNSHTLYEHGGPK
jgi:hypothetical protein